MTLGNNTEKNHTKTKAHVIILVSWQERTQSKIYKL